MSRQEPSPSRGRRRLVALLLIAAATAWPAWFAFGYGVLGHRVATTVVAAEPGLCRDGRSSVPCWRGLVELDGRRTTVQGGPWIPFRDSPNERLVGDPIVVRDRAGRPPVTEAEVGWAAAFAVAGLLALGIVAFRGRLLGRPDEARRPPSGTL